MAEDSKFYSFHAKTLDGDDFDFSSLKGKVVLIVNVASKWYVICNFCLTEKWFHRTV